MRHTAIALLLFALGCGSMGSSGTRPASLAAADVTVRPASKLFFGSSSTAPLTLEVQITNRAAEPVKVRSVRLTSLGMMEYTLRPYEQFVNQTLQAGETKTFTVPMTAVAAAGGLSPTEPLTARAEVYFEARGKTFVEIYSFPGLSV